MSGNFFFTPEPAQWKAQKLKCRRELRQITWSILTILSSLFSRKLCTISAHKTCKYAATISPAARGGHCKLIQRKISNKSVFKKSFNLFFSPLFFFLFSFPPPSRDDLTYRISLWESIHDNVTEFSRLMKVKLSRKHMKTCCVEFLYFPFSI